jgi:hypothetical protein
VIRVGAAPNAGRLIEHVAFFGIRTTAGTDPWGVGQVIGRIDHFGLKGNFMPNVVAKPNFCYFPDFGSHFFTIILQNKFKRCLTTQPVTGVINAADKGHF